MATTYSDVMTTGQLPDALRTIYSAELMQEARPRLFFDNLCDVKNEPGKQKGETVVWTTIEDLPPETGALTEDTDVDATGLTDFQVSVSVDEHGMAVGTTEKLEVLTYFPPLAQIVREKVSYNLALSLDTMARNKFWSGSNKWYAGNATSRASLDVGDVLTKDVVARAVRNLKERDVVTFDAINVMAAIHPALTYDLRRDSDFVNAQLYAGSTRLFNGEIGQIEGCRFVETTRAVIPNGGAVIAQSSLAANALRGASTISVSSATGFAAGQRITIGSQATPDGTDATSEEAVIQSISGNIITLKRKLKRAHAFAHYVTKALDIYPVVFLGKIAVGKALALAPEIRVALPTDKLRRMSYVGWYGIFGYGLLNDDHIEIVECGATA